MITHAQQQALAWLADHNGSGVWSRSRLLAAGEIAPIRRTTWNTLRDLECVTIENSRITLTDAGRKVAAEKPWRGFDASAFEEEAA